MRFIDYIMFFAIVALFLTIAGCSKSDDRCINYYVDQYKLGETVCEDGICEDIYITEIFCSYYENRSSNNRD